MNRKDLNSQLQQVLVFPTPYPAGPVLNGHACALIPRSSPQQCLTRPALLGHQIELHIFLFFTTCR